MHMYIMMKCLLYSFSIIRCVEHDILTIFYYNFFNDYGD